MPRKSSDERIAEMTFGAVYPLYVSKVEKKGKTREQLDEVIRWLTGYSDEQLQHHRDQGTTFEQFFAEATLHANAGLIKGVICGHRVEDIENPLTQKVRYLDKLVDELARGKKMASILRS